MKNIYIFLIVFAISFIGYKVFVFKPSGVDDSQAQLILFWGDGCPHCEKVKDYISEKKLDSVVKIAYKEVYYNKTNQNLLIDTVKKCPEIDSTQNVGVPLAFDKTNSKCLYGDQPIIDWLSSRVIK